MCENHVNGKMRSIAQILKINREYRKPFIWKYNDYMENWRRIL